MGSGHASLSKIDCKSLFRNILPASLVRSIFYVEARKILKTWDLHLELSTTESIFCKQDIDNKYLTFDGGTLWIFQFVSTLNLAARAAARRQYAVINIAITTPVCGRLCPPPIYLCFWPTLIPRTTLTPSSSCRIWRTEPAIQIGFMQLIHGVAQQRLEQWRARMILSALHGAAANLRLMDAASAQCEMPQRECKEEESASRSPRDTRVPFSSN